MKLSLVLTVALASATAFAAEPKTAPKTAAKAAPKDALAAAKEQAAFFGGLLPRPASGHVAYCDYQKRIAANDMMEFFVSSQRCPIRLGYKHVPMTGTFDFAKAAAARGDAAAAVFFVDDPALPMSLVALEEKWGLVNVAKLAADNPKTLTLLRRAEKLTTRVITVILGGCYCLHTPFSAMKPVYSLAELDKMEAFAIDPSALTQIMHSLDSLGLKPAGLVTYEHACIEGWAPAPTNDVQREIWNDVKNPANRFKKDLPELKKK